MQALRVWRQFGKVGLSGQRYRSQYRATVEINMPFQVGQGPTHANNVIYQNVFASWSHGSFKFSLLGQSPKSFGSGVGNHVDLNHAGVHGPAQYFAELVGKHLGNGVRSFLRKSMGAYQCGRPGTDQRLQFQCLDLIDGLKIRSDAASPSPALAALYAECCFTADSLA
jgi:hypothetical protein